MTSPVSVPFKNLILRVKKGKVKLKRKCNCGKQQRDYLPHILIPHSTGSGGVYKLPGASGTGLPVCYIGLWWHLS